MFSLGLIYNTCISSLGSESLEQNKCCCYVYASICQLWVTSNDELIFSLSSLLLWCSVNLNPGVVYFMWLRANCLSYAFSYMFLNFLLWCCELLRDSWKCGFEFIFCRRWRMFAVEIITLHVWGKALLWALLSWRTVGVKVFPYDNSH